MPCRRRCEPLAGLFAEDLDHQIAEAVDDLRVLLEIGRGVDHAEGLDDADDLVEAADLLFAIETTSRRLALTILVLASASPTSICFASCTSSAALNSE